LPLTFSIIAPDFFSGCPSPFLWLLGACYPVVPGFFSG
jgi:hypothetical protein